MFLQSDKHNVQALMNTDLVLYNNEEDVLVFRRLLEAAMLLGYWNGFVGLS